MNPAPEVPFHELVLDGQRITLFHLRAIAAFRRQWHADPPGEVLAGDPVARCARERQLDKLFIRLVNDAGAESIDALHEEAVQMMRIVKG